MISRSLLILLLISFLFIDLKAQENFAHTENTFIRFSTGYSPTSILFLGKTPDTQTTLIQLNYGKKLDWEFKTIPVFYLISITPYIHYDYPKRDQNGIRDVVTGFGFSPIGFEINKNLKKNFGLSLSTAGGFILTNKKFPTDKGRRLNYTYELTPKMFLEIHDSVSLFIGYKFHHISNAQTGSENPGIDSNFIFFSTHISI
ncbi:MAG: acyloxyacyl hydrolase [Balneola sp.]